MGTFSITTYNNQLVILYNSEEGDEIQLSSITFFNPSVEVKGNKFSFFESGTYKKSISFKEIYLINDVEPTDSEDAFNKIIEGIANFNRGGAAPYKVYTALLTQSGGDNGAELTSGILEIGVTYRIDSTGGSGWDFTNVGASNNNVGTYFVATGTTPNSWQDGQLTYNTGAPVVTVLENTIGNIWFEYVSSGFYRMSSNELFTLGKSWSVIGPSDLISNLLYQQIFFNNISNYDIATFSEGNLTNSLLFNTPIEIRVYN
jgi:hypothetical protein